jgi:hypothetical protein
MPKKVKRHLLCFLRVTGVYVGIMGALEVGNLLMGLISQPDAYTKIGQAVTAVYFATGVWFCWRFHTGVYRDGDFLD